MSRTKTARDTARRVFEIESSAIEGLSERLDDAFDEAVERLIGCRGRVIVSGMGKSGIICQKIAATLTSTGTPAHFLHPAEALHGDLGMIVAGDVLVAVSNSGETEEIVRLLELVGRLGATIIGLSGQPGSTLARHADIHLNVGVDQEACGLDLVPTASTTAALAMGDALAVACFERRGLSSDDFLRFHPGGRLGRRLRQVRDLMHRGDAMPVVRDDAPLPRAVEAISAGKLGMVCVVDAEARLCGVLTDGDLRRRLLAEPAPLDGTVADAMTRDPHTIGESALATAALQLLEKNRITSLPVVNDAGALVGVIQIHDLWRTELF